MNTPVNEYDDGSTTINKLRKHVRQLFKTKYKTDAGTYHMKVINEIIYNEKSRVVAVFKDFLILDDISEFLRRFYEVGELKSRLNKVIEFYELYSRIFPNYIIIPESKYLYKNIRRKQKMIDAANQIKSEEEENRRNIANGIGINEAQNQRENKNNFFDSEIKKSILRYHPSYYLNDTTVIHNKTLNSIVKQKDDSISFSISYKDKIDPEESLHSIRIILNAIDEKTLKKKINDDKITLNNINEIKKKLKNNLNENLVKTKNFIFPGSLEKINPINSNTGTNNANIGNSQKIFNRLKNNLGIKNNSISKPNQVINQNNHLNPLTISTPLISPLTGLVMPVTPTGNLASQQSYHPYYQIKPGTENHKFITRELTAQKNNNTNNNTNINTSGNLTGIILEKPFVKKLPMKQINKPKIKDIELTETKILSTEPNEFKKPEFKTNNKLGTHRVSSSIPELYSTLKILNNYPNIIIPSSTHISINQNYYNYNEIPGVSRVPTIENMENYNKLTSTNQTGNKPKDRALTSKINRTKTFSKKSSNKKLSHLITNSGISYVQNTSNNNYVNMNQISYITPKNLKMKTTNYNYNLNNLNTESNLSNNLNSNLLANTLISPTNKISNTNNSKQAYSKVFKVFQDNFKNIHTLDSYKNKKLKERLMTTVKGKEREDRNSIYARKETTTNEAIEEESNILETERQIKTRIEIREAYKKYLERNKLECFTTRNSLDVKSYKAAPESTKNINYLSSHNSVNFNSTHYLDKKQTINKNNYLSPSNVIKTHSQHSLKKINFKLETPMKPEIKKSNLKQVDLKDETNLGKNRIKSYFGHLVKDTYKSTKKLESSKNILSPNDFSAKIVGKQFVRGAVKSLDFQTLKNIKKK